MGKLRLAFLIGSLLLVASCGSKSKSGESAEKTLNSNNAPVIESFYVDPSEGSAPLNVKFIWSVKDADRDSLTCYIDVNGDGNPEYRVVECENKSSQTHTYKVLGQYKVIFSVSDGKTKVEKTSQVNVKNDPPLIENFTASPSSGSAPLTVTFSWKVSNRDGDPLTCYLDVDGDGNNEYKINDCDKNTSINHTYTGKGSFNAKLSVSDGMDITASLITININNYLPVISSFSASPNTGPVPLDVTFSWSVSDLDGDPVICYIDVDGDNTDDYTVNDCTVTSSQLHTYLNEGIYQVKLTAYDGTDYNTAYLNIQASPSWILNVGSGNLEVLRDVAQLPNGDFVITGYYSKSRGAYEMIVGKINPDGTVAWIKQIGDGTSNEDSGWRILPTQDGGFIVAGVTRRHRGVADIWIVKFDSSGNIIWENSYGGQYADYGFHIIETSDGGFLVTGSSISYSNSEDIWILKLNGDGTVNWQKVIGGAGTDKAYSAVEDSGGNYVITGYYSTSQGSEIWVLKLSTNGNIIWQKIFGDNSTGMEVGRSVTATSDGGYLIAGTTDSYGNGSKDLLIIKLDKNGNLMWSKVYGGAGSENAYTVIETSDGGYIVAGATDSFGAGLNDGWLIKIDNNGTIVWEKTYGGSANDILWSVKETQDGGFVATGYSVSFSGNLDMLIIKAGRDGRVKSCTAVGTGSSNTIDITQNLQVSIPTITVNSSNTTPLNETSNSAPLSLNPVTICPAI